MTDQPANINLRLALDQAALNQSKAGVGDLDQTLAALAARTKDTGASADDAASSIGKAMSSIRSSVDDDTKAVNSLNNALKETSQVAETAAKSGGGLSDIGGLRRTGSALTQLGLGAIGEPIRKIGDLQEVIKKLGEVSEAVGPMLEATAVSFGGIEIALGPLLLALAPVAIAVGAVAVAMKLMSDAAQKAAEDEKAAYEQEKALLLEKEADRRVAKSKTTQQNQEDIANLVQDRQDTMDALAKAQAARQKTAQDYANLGQSFNPAERSRLGALGAQQDKDILDLSNHLNDLNKQYVNLTGVLQPMIDVEQAHKKVLEDQKKAQAEVDQGLEKSISLAQQNQQLIESSSSKSVQTRIDGIEAEKKAINDALATHKASADETDKLKDRLAELTGEEKNLTDAVLPAIKAREAETQATKEFTKEAQAAQKELDAIGKAIDATVKGIADAQRNLADQIKTGTEREAFNEQKEKENEAQALLKISTDYARKQVDLAQQSADQAAKALLSLKDTFAKDALTLQRNQQQDALNDLYKQQDIVRKAAEQEVLDKQAHLQKLKDIQHQYDSSNFQALLDRNFLQIAKNVESQKNAITNENDHYADLENQRRENLAMQLGDEQIAYQRQRQARLITYQQQIQDAEIQYARTLRDQQIADEIKARDEQIAHQRAIEDARTAAIQRLTILREGLVEEIKLYQQAEQQKIAILMQTQTQLAAQAAKQIISNPLVQTGMGLIGGLVQAFTTHRAAGGPLEAGQASWVNEPGSSGNESFNGINLPGAGLFLPSRAGNVNANGGNGRSTTINFTINGASDPVRTADMVEQRISTFMERLTA